MITERSHTYDLTCTYRCCKGLVSELFSLMDVGEMYLECRKLYRCDRIADSDGSMGIGCRVDDDTVRITDTLLDTVHDLTFEVALEEFDLHFVLLRKTFHLLMDIFQFHRTIDILFSDTEHIEVGTLDYYNFHFITFLMYILGYDFIEIELKGDVMKIISADHIYTPNGFIEHEAVAFDTHIRGIGPLEGLLSVYPDAEIIRTAPYSVVYPGFINTHVHLEFSANKTSLRYGSFMPWLDSVIEHRDDLVNACDNALMQKECDEMLYSGITTFGAISSFGTELEVCEKAAQRVVFFNEVIGSNAATADMLYGDFLERVSASRSCDREARIIPAVAVHSPYSVHPIILQKAVTLAKQHKMPLSAHFLESQAERQWLEKGEGELKAFFEKYFNTTVPVTNIEEFMHAFDTYPTHFAHAVQATPEELAYLSKKGHSIAHCPRSNRYLGCGRLKIEALDLPFSVATDGLSSNDSLNIFDEFRAALMLHNDIPIHTLAEQLIKASTRDAAEILGLDCGKIEVGAMADLAVLTLPAMPQSKEEVALWSIIHTKKVSQVYIEGEQHV